jgi:tartrate-resistant acid phosphatase type 5
MRRTVILLVATAALSGCVWHFNALSGPAQAPTPPLSLQFIAFGDAGTGGERQAAVGRAMARVCADRGCDFALELGDNFYPNGAHSADDPQFQSAFEKPYELFNLPVYVVLGNHDNGSAGGEGNNNARGDFQVQYHSPKWKMPARYYNFALPVESSEPFAEFFALDSSPLAPYLLDPDPNWAPAAYGAQQLAWLQQRTQASKASWKIAFAHHPYVSNGLHGDAGNYETHPGDTPAARGEQWKTLIDQGVCANHVDLYLAGHDHDLEWLKPVPGCGNTQFIVSGAAAPDELRSFVADHHDAVYWHADQAAGFFWIKLEQNRMTVAAFTLNAKDELPVVTQHGHPVPAYEQSVQRLP